MLAASLALLLQSASPAADAMPPASEGPPERIVDFLGRRRLCLELPEPADREAGDEREARRLQCDRLASEERIWRRLYATDPGVLAWIDRDPRTFETGAVVVHSYHGPPSARARRIELSGTDAEDSSPFRLVIDSSVEGGRFTIVTASYAGLPPRRFTIENARFPQLDLQSARAWLKARPPHDRLAVELRFGYPRGYCGDVDSDDRPSLSIGFFRERIIASYRDATNCNYDHVDLPDGAGPDR